MIRFNYKRKEVGFMAYDCCVNCRYGEYQSSSDKTSLGSNEQDVYCVLYRKWVGCNGSCSNYEED
jgi:hypothetical protein